MKRTAAILPLLIATLLVAISMTVPAQAKVARGTEDINGLTQIHSAPKGSIAAMSGWMPNASGEDNCSAQLVGPDVMVTASHCLRSGAKSVGPKSLTVQIGRHRTEDGDEKYLYECQGHRWWSGMPAGSNGSEYGDAWGGQDIGVFSVANCKTMSGNRVSYPGIKTGFFDVAAFSFVPEDNQVLSYQGYPTGYSTPGHLQRTVDSTRACNQDNASTGLDYVCLDADVKGGGSGGALFQAAGGPTLLGVAHANFGDVNYLLQITGRYTVFNYLTPAYVTQIENVRSGRWHSAPSSLNGSGGVMKISKPKKGGGFNCTGNPNKGTFHCTITIQTRD